MKKIIIFLILIVLSATNVFSQQNISQQKKGRSQYLKAIECYNNYEYKKAVYWFQESAEQGYADAMYNLAMCYKNNKGIQISSKNDSIAAEWFYRSYKNGNRKAKKELDKLNIEPICDVIAMYYPLNVYDERIVATYFYYNKNDYEQAVYWYKKAAEQGDVEAQNNLGVCYKIGKGVEQDFRQAVYWYKKAAEQGNDEAKIQLRELDRTDYIQSKNSNNSFFYKQKKSAEEGNAQAQYNLGLCYYNGEGVEQDYKQAVYWYKKAAEQGDVEAQYNLGVCYKIGKGVEQDFRQAVYWYKKAAEQGNDEAKIQLRELDRTDYIQLKKHYNISEFNSPKGRIRKYGPLIGYVSKKWTRDGYENDRIEENKGYKFGFRIEPLYKYGFGINTGPFTEIYDTPNDDSLLSISFNVPINIEYRLNFSRNFQLFFYGGLNFELYFGYLIDKKTEKIINLNYSNISKEYGIGFRINLFQFDIGISKGLLNSTRDFHMKQQISMTISIMI